MILLGVLKRWAMIAPRERKPHPRKADWFLTAAIFRVLLSPLAAQPEQEQSDKGRSYSLLVIVFESNPTPVTGAEKNFDPIDLPSTDFPMIFSRMFMPSSQTQKIELPSGVSLPREAMFLDIHTFRLTETQIRKNKRISRRNDLQGLQYRITPRSWSNDRYEIEVEGKHAGAEFQPMLIPAAADKTKLVSIRPSANRTLFFALTLLNYKNILGSAPEAAPAGVASPRAILQPPPSYPSTLLKSGWSGTVQILVIVNASGKIDRERFMLLECPHYLFARNSLDVVLNRWTFRPATVNGVAADVLATIEIGFQCR